MEDDAHIRETLSILLQKRGYKTETAETGQEATRKSEAKSYNGALLDIKLPDIEGTELLTTMHENMPENGENRNHWVSFN